MSSRNLSAFRVIFAATSTTWIYRLINAVSGLITLPLLVTHLNKVEFGIWFLVIQVVNFLALSDLGVATAVSRFVARLRGANDVAGLRQLLSTVLVLMIGLALIIAALTVAAAPWVPGMLGIDQDYAEVTSQVFLIAGLSLAAQFPLRIGMGILTGHQLYGPHGVGKIIESVVTTVGIVALAWLNRIELVPLAMVSGFSSAGSQAVLLLTAWWMTRPWQVSLRNLSLPMARDLLSLGSSTLLITMSSLLYNQGIGIAIGRLVGVEAVGIYGVALTIINNLQPLMASLSNPFITLASEWQARDEMERMRRTSTLVMRITAALAASAAAGLFVYGEPALRLLFNRSTWTAQDYAAAHAALVIMGFGLAVGLPQLVSRLTLQGIGRHWLVSYGALASSVVAFGIGVLTMGAGWGIVGAALGWSMVWILQAAVIYPPMLSRYLQQSLWQMLAQVYLPGFAAGGCVLILALGCTALFDPLTLPGLLIGVGICTFLGGLILVAISGQSRTIWVHLRKRSI